MATGQRWDKGLLLNVGLSLLTEGATAGVVRGVGWVADQVNVVKQTLGNKVQALGGWATEKLAAAGNLAREGWNRFKGWAEDRSIQRAIERWNDPNLSPTERVKVEQFLREKGAEGLWQGGVANEGIESVTGRARATPIYDRFGDVTIVGPTPGDIQKVRALFEEAAQASGVKLSKYVDVIEYVPKARAPSFDVTRISGQRIIIVNAKTFRKTRAGQLIVASHELVHAQKFGRITKYKFGGDVFRAREYFFGPDFDQYTRLGRPRYAFDEVVAERLAVARVKQYLGGLTPQQIGWSTRYIDYWRKRFASPTLFP